MTAAIVSRTSSSFVTSARWNSTSPRASPSWCAASRPRLSSTSMNATNAPSATNFSTMAYPMPGAPPVTKAIFPGRRCIFSSGSLPRMGVILYVSVRTFLAVAAALTLGACARPIEQSGGTVPANRGTVTRAPFGTLPDGKAVPVITLTNADGLEIRTIPYGARIVSIKTRDRNGTFGDIVHGFDTLDGYLATNPYFGPVVGRYGNRIAKGQFAIDGTTFHLATNNGPNHLHGGVKGFDKLLWTTETFQSNRDVGVVYTLTSADGDEGYPGTLNVRVSYSLKPDNTLTVEYQATTD